MKMPHDQTRRMCCPSKWNLDCPVERADRMDRICWATTDNTSMLIRLNSSKQPQAPVCSVADTVKDLLCMNTNPIQAVRAAADRQRHSFASKFLSENSSLLRIIIPCNPSSLLPVRGQSTCVPWICNLVLRSSSLQ